MSDYWSCVPDCPHPNPYDDAGPPDPSDACMVCNRIDCQCPPEAIEKQIQGCPGYFASSDGEIISRRNWRGLGERTLFKRLDTDGYFMVRLTDSNGKNVKRMVHSLIAAAFLGPRPPRHETRHLDGNRLNNALSNLAWGTAKENAADRESHGNTSRGEKHSEIVKRGMPPLKTHCKRGHLLPNKIGKRECQICSRERHKIYEQKKKQKTQ